MNYYIVEFASKKDRVKSQKQFFTELVHEDESLLIMKFTNDTEAYDKLDEVCKEHYSFEKQ